MQPLLQMKIINQSSMGALFQRLLTTSTVSQW
jgi:hypothetical protein